MGLCQYPRAQDNCRFSNHSFRRGLDCNPLFEGNAGTAKFSAGVLPIDWLLSILLVGWFRFSLRLLADSRSAPTELKVSQQRILVVGAGDAGALVVREMQKNPQLNITPVCFLDDDPAKQKQQIHGVPVIGNLDDLSRTVTLRRIDEVVIALPSAPGSVVRKVAEICRRKGVPLSHNAGDL